MDNIELNLGLLINEYIEEFKNSDPKYIDNYKKIKNTLKKKNKVTQQQNLLPWLLKLDVIDKVPFQSFLFWLWQKEIISYEKFEKTYYDLTPTVTKSWSYPLIITSGIDDPLLGEGFVDHEFSIFQYKFIPANHGFLLECKTFPNEMTSSDLNPDSILSFFSFILEKSNYGSLGFRQIKARKFEHTETEAVHSDSGPETRIVGDFNFSKFEKVLCRIENLSAIEKSSIFELLNIRHRAVIDSSNESKLITLWSFIEAKWGKADKEDSLITTEEKKNLKREIGKILGVEKTEKVIDLISTLKKKTQKEKIIENLSSFLSEDIHNIKKNINKIYRLRNRIAHGGLLTPTEERDLVFLVPILFEVINKHITKKMDNLSIEIG